MKSRAFLQIAAAVALLSVAAFFCCLTWEARRIPAALDQLESDVNSRIAAATVTLASQVEAARKDLITTSSAQLATSRQEVLTEVDQTRAALLSAVSMAAAPAHQAAGTLQQLADGLKPIVQHAQNISARVDDASGILLRRDALPAQILGTVAAAKTTLGQTTLTMRTFQQAEPKLLDAAQKVADNSDAATAKTVAAAEESRRLLHNLAENTTPLPKWLRYPLQVIGLAGSAAVPVVTLQKLETVK